MKKSRIGIIIFAVIIVIAVGISFSMKSSKKKEEGKAITVYGAVGGGKENFLQDEDISQILLEKYNIVLKVDNWSNGKLVQEPLVYGEGNKSTAYDFVFFSDERFYEYYKTPAQGEEADRQTVLKGMAALNTPVVVYSWDSICEALIKEGIVTERSGIYYITDMKKLMDYITGGTTWEDIGVKDIFGKINIASTDPVTSSPGATYYGLLASIMNQGFVDENSIGDVMPELTAFYKYSGFMNNTPADLFELYMRMGRGAYPLVVDYEKSMIDFANQNPESFDQLKDRVRILYPEPTLWNSHCIMSFSENGSIYVDALADKEIQEIAWKKYGFRTGISGGQYDVTSVPVIGIPQEIVSVARSLKKDVYDTMVNGLKMSK